MGASTVWNAVGLRPGLFAAAIPVAGVPNPELADAVAQTPLWIVHGNADMVKDLRRFLFLERGVPRAAVSISGPIERLTRQPGRLHAEVVVQAARQLTEAVRATTQ